MSYTMFDIDKDTALVPEIIADKVTTSRRLADRLCQKARQRWRDDTGFRRAFDGKDERDVLEAYFRSWAEEELQKPFHHDVNLDCPVGLEQFLETYEPDRGRRLANRLAFRGRFSVRAADALIGYAHNKQAAMWCRELGYITEAEKYERICDRIYDEDIQPLIHCW